MVKSTIQVTLFSLLGIGINFLIQLLLAYYFGATQERDAYFAASTIPAYITVLFTGSIGMMLLPYLVKYQTTHSSIQIVKFTSAIINFCFILLLIIIVAGYFFAGPIIHIMLPVSKYAILSTTVFLFRIQMLSILFTVMSTLLAAVFQARHSFLIPSLFPIITGLITMLFVAIFSKSLGISSVVLGTLSGAIVAFLFMFFNVLKKFAYKWSFSIGEGQLQGVLYASLPLFAAGILFRSTTVFERFFAARLPQGSLSYLGSGNQIIVILSTIVSSGIATTSFPLFSKYWAVNDLESLKKTFSRVISFVLLIIFPMIIIFAISGIDIIRVVFERGAFMAKDTEALYNTLLGLMGFFLFSSIGNVLIRILYLSNHTIAVAVIATIELVVYLICAMILTRLFQYVGLALSMSIGACCNVIISFIFIRKKVVNLDMYTLLRRLGSIFISSVFILLFFFLANKYFLQHVNLVVRVIIISIMVIAAYVLLMSRMLKNIGYRQLIHL